ncbi:MAG: endo-alpha-N-acetylgalactosaminidase family protein [Eubacteriales bacterium]
MPKYDYMKTMMMKLFMAHPDQKGGSIVDCDFESALEIVKQTDALTLGAPKIIYLVGWQYNGHDDKYPSFGEVNHALKRPPDKTALESMLWFIEEAKKYNTVISVHINFADAYDNCPLMKEYRKSNALIRDRQGKPAAIEKYNGLPCYKVSYKEEWVSGLFHKRMQALFDILPVKEAGTVHVDNFQCYVNRKPKVSIKTMQAYRKKMIDYLSENGIDVTSEFTYREGPLTVLLYGKIIRDVLWHLYPVDTLGQIPAIWWVDKLTKREIFRNYPEKYAGGMLKGKWGQFLYGNLHGEDLWNQQGDAWHKEFLRQFAAINTPYFYLATLQKEKLTGRGKNTRMVYSDGTISYLNEQKIAKNGVLLKVNDDLLLPVTFKNDTRIAYSKNGCKRSWQLPVYSYKSAKLYDISPKGLEFIGETSVENGRILLDIASEQGIMVELFK